MAVINAEVTKLASATPCNKTPGPEAIPGEAIKILTISKPEWIATVFNRCLAEGKFPSAWKRAQLVLLQKGDKPLCEPSSYKPLCILDLAGKLLDKVVDTRLKDLYEEREMLTTNQYGFRRGRSTVDAMPRLMGIVRRGLDATCMAGVLTLDIKNAFNCALWCKIMESLNVEGVPGCMCRLLEDYFSESVTV